MNTNLFKIRAQTQIVNEAIFKESKREPKNFQELNRIIYIDLKMYQCIMVGVFFKDKDIKNKELLFLM